MAGDYLLDTNILIAFFSGERNVAEKIADANVIHLSSIALGELNYGAKRSTRVTENLERIEQLLQWAEVLTIDAKVASVYGDIKKHLAEKGKLIPDNDIWIAAVARQYALTLVTRDEHFQQVSDLELQAW
jgi:tRNA(fMet)-specific endonuclease VapC